MVAPVLQRRVAELKRPRYVIRVSSPPSPWALRLLPSPLGRIDHLRRSWASGEKRRKYVLRTLITVSLGRKRQRLAKTLVMKCDRRLGFGDRQLYGR